MNVDDEKQLIERVVHGDSKAFRTFVERYKRLVAHVVFRMVPNVSDREDLCQDVFVKAYENLKDFHFQSKLSTWLARIAYNTSINYLKKMRAPLLDDLQPEHFSFDQLSGVSPTPIEDVEDQDHAALLRRHIAALPPVFKAILTLYHLEEMSYAEIGDSLNLPQGTVKSYLFRARKLLRERLTAQYQEEELW